MSQRRRHRNKNKGNVKKSKRGLWFSEINPTEGFSHDEFAAQMRSLGEKREQDFPRELNELKSAILACDPILLLSTLSFYSQAAFVKKDGSTTHSPHKIWQHHVELVQALALQYLHTDFAVSPALPGIVQDIMDRVLRISDTFSLKRMKDITFGEEEPDKAKRLIQEQLRLHTQAVRNWGYPEQVAQLVTDLLHPLEGMLTAELGYCISTVFMLSLKQLKIINRRQKEYFNRLRELLKGRTIEELVENYFKASPDDQGRPDELIDYLKKVHANLDQARSLILSHSEMNLAPMKTFTAQEFGDSKAENIEPTSISIALDDLSLSFGDLADNPSEHLFLDNPCWTRPFIKLPPSKYFEPITAQLIAYPFEVIEFLLRDREDLLDLYFNRRAEFLQERIEADFRTALPGAQIAPGNLWSDSEAGKTYENDLLVVLDCYAIVVEAKAGHVTAPARRGALGRLEKVTEELIQSASEQSQGFAEWIGKNNRLVSFETRRGVVNRVDLSKVKSILRLTVLLDDIAAVQTMSSELHDAGLIPAHVKIAVTMTLADLEIVLRILNSPSLLMHYLKRRTELGAHTDFIADEIDLLGVYLETGFNIGEQEFDGTSLLLTGMSESVDRWYMAHLAGTTPKSPELEMTEWWRSLLGYFEQKRPDSWLHMTLKLLSVPNDDQLAVQRKFNKTKKNVRRNWRVIGHLNTVLLVVGPQKRKDGFAFLAYREVDRDKRHIWSEQAANRLLAETGVTEVLVIGENIDRLDDPASYMVLYHMGGQTIQII